MEELKDKNGLTEKEFFEQYKPKDYKKPSVTADIVIFQKINSNLKLLLIKRAGHPYIGKYALPGGFSEEGEDLLHTATRELEEETMLKNLPLEEVGLFSTPNRDPRGWVISNAYVSLVNKELNAVACDDASDVKLFEVSFEEDLEKLTITLFNKEELIVELFKEKRIGITGNVIEYKQIKSDLAFDHGEIIAKALQKIKEVI